MDYDQVTDFLGTENLSLCRTQLKLEAVPSASVKLQYSVKLHPPARAGATASWRVRVRSHSGHHKGDVVDDRG